MYREDALISISSENQWINAEVANLIPFDDRFDNDGWTVEAAINSDSSLEQALSLDGAAHNKAAKHIAINNGDIGLRLHLVSNVRNNKIVHTVEGYTLSNNAITPEMQPIPRSEIFSALESYLKTDDPIGFETSRVTDLAIGDIWQDENTRLLLFDASTILEVTGDSVSKLYLFESVFQNQSGEPWRYLSLTQGQDLESAMTLLGDEAFEFDNQVEFSGETHISKLFFYDDQLTTAEVSIY